jgi:Flp pilus assembly protein TadG
MLQKIKKEQGSIIVLTAVLLPVFLGFMGIGIDVGKLYMHKARLQNVADAAALAGAREFVNQKETPDSHNKTDTEANKYINNNVVNLNNTENVTQDGKSHLVRQSVDGTKTKTYYRIGLTETVGLNFLPILPGINRNATVQASAVALAEGTASSNTLPSVPVGEGASFSIFDNLFTFSEYLFIGNINENHHAYVSFDGRMVYTMLNNNTERGSSDFFYKFNSPVGMEEEENHMYNQKGNTSNGVMRSNINDPYVNPYFSTRDYIAVFDQWLKTDETGKKLYVEVPSEAVGQNCTTEFINQYPEYNVFHYGYTGNISQISIGQISTTHFDINTPLYIIIEDTVNFDQKTIAMRNNNRPVVIVYKGTGRVFIDGSQDGKLVIYAPDAEIYLVNTHGQYSGNIIAKRLLFGGGSSKGSWVVKNYLENGNDYIDPYIKARREQIEASIMANAATANSQATFEGIINAVQDFLNNGHNFTKHANEILALFGYLYDDKHGTGYNGSNANDIRNWYNHLTESQKRALVSALKDYLYGSDFGSGTSGSGGSGGGTSQSVDASSVKIRLISDSELKDTPFATL